MEVRRSLKTLLALFLVLGCRAQPVGNATYIWNHAITAPVAGNDGQVFYWDNSSNTYKWKSVAGSVGGSNTQVQFNDNGALGGSSGFTFDKPTGNVGIGTTVPPAGMPAGSVSASAVYVPNTKRNVRNYGAAGDGVTNDYYAFTAAQAVGGVVYVPPGTYYLGTAFTMTSATSIECDSGAILLFGATDGVIWISASQNAHMSGCTLMTNSVSGGKAIKFTGFAATAANISQYTIAGTGGGKWAYGIWMGSSELVNFFGGQITNAATIPIHLENSTAQNTFYGTNISVAGTIGVESTGGAQPCTRNRFIGSTIAGSASTALLSVAAADEVESFNSLWEQTHATAPAVLSGGSYRGTYDMYHNVGTYSVRITSGARFSSLDHTVGGVVVMDAGSLNNWVTGHVCGATPCVVDNGTAPSSNIVMYSVNTGAGNWSQGLQMSGWTADGNGNFSMNSLKIKDGQKISGRDDPFSDISEELLFGDGPTLGGYFTFRTRQDTSPWTMADRVTIQADGGIQVLSATPQTCVAGLEGTLYYVTGTPSSWQACMKKTDGSYAIVTIFTAP